MLTLYVRNISKLKPISDYEYVVMFNAEKIAAGVVKGHKRKDGWRKLIRMIADGEKGESFGFDNNHAMRD